MSKSYKLTKRCNQADDQIFNFWFSVKIDQTQSIGILDFLSVKGHRQSCHCISYQDKKSVKLPRQKIGINIILDQGSPIDSPNPIWQCQSMRTLCLKQRLCIELHSFSSLAVLSEMQHILPSLEGDNRALARKNHVQARCKFSSRTPASLAEQRTVTSSSKFPRRDKSKDFASKRLIFGKSGPDRDICTSAMKLFLLEIHPEYQHCELPVSLECHFAWQLRRWF